MPYDPVQVQGHGGPKVAKMVDFKLYLSIFFSGMHVL